MNRRSMAVIKCEFWFFKYFFAYCIVLTIIGVLDNGLISELKYLEDERICMYLVSAFTILFDKIRGITGLYLATVNNEEGKAQVNTGANSIQDVFKIFLDNSKGPHPRIVKAVLGIQDHFFSHQIHLFVKEAIPFAYDLDLIIGNDFTIQWR